MFPACHPGPVNQAQTISNTIKQFRENVPDYVASGFVDLSTGMLLDVDTVANHPREILDVVAAVVICTREVSVGMLFAQARQVMREYEAASSEPRGYEAAGSEAMAPSRD